MIGEEVEQETEPGTVYPDRLAVLYARQSTYQQVTENRESTTSTWG